MDLLIAGFAVLVGALVQGCSGFAFSLVGVPIMMLAFPGATVVPIMILLGVGLNFMVWWDSRRAASFREILPLLVGGVVGIPLGTGLLLRFPASSFQMVVGVTVCLVALLLLSGRTFSLGSSIRTLFPVGLLSGILNGSLSLSGPPVVLFLAGKRTGKDRFRASLSTYFLSLNVFCVGYFAWQGLFPLPVLKTSLYLLPVLVVGTFAGISLSRLLREETFRRVVLGLVLLTGAIQLRGVLGG